MYYAEFNFDGCLLCGLSVDDAVDGCGVSSTMWIGRIVLADTVWTAGEDENSMQLADRGLRLVVRLMRQRVTIFALTLCSDAG
jgi:hypothetical protein